MRGDKRRFLVLRKEKWGNVTFGNNGLAKIIGKGMVSLGNKRSEEENVLLIDNVKHTLLNISQSHVQGHALEFDSKKCEIRSEKYGRLVARAFRTPINIYNLDEVNGVKCWIG